MKRSALLMTALLFCTWAIANAKINTYDGWLSDSKCGVKGANAAHAQCAKKCVENGEKPVLVTDKEQKVVPIDNPDAVSGSVGQHVKVTGTMTDSGSLKVDKVAPSAAQ